jgi:hypothetical protein
MNESWIKLFNNVTDWRYYDDDFMFRFYLTLVLDANEEDKKWHGIIIKRGQLVTSLSHLAMQFNKSMRQIRTALKKLNGQEIIVNSTTKFTMITIVDYDNLQM